MQSFSYAYSFYGPLDNWAMDLMITTGATNFFHNGEQSIYDRCVSPDPLWIMQSCFFLPDVLQSVWSRHLLVDKLFKLIRLFNVDPAFLCEARGVLTACGEYPIMQCPWRFPWSKEQTVANHTSCVMLLVIVFSSQDLTVILVSKHPLDQFLHLDATENEDLDAESPIADKEIIYIGTELHYLDVVVPPQQPWTLHKLRPHWPENNSRPLITYYLIRYPRSFTMASKCWFSESPLFEAIFSAKKGINPLGPNPTHSPWQRRSRWSLQSLGGFLKHCEWCHE